MSSHRRMLHWLIKISYKPLSCTFDRTSSRLLSGNLNQYHRSTLLSDHFPDITQLSKKDHFCYSSRFDKSSMSHYYPRINEDLEFYVNPYDILTFFGNTILCLCTWLQSKPFMWIFLSFSSFDVDTKLFLTQASIQKYESYHKNLCCHYYFNYYESD